MANHVSPLLPSTTELLRQFGDRLRLARLRRRLTAKQVAERAGMAPMTLRNVERGGPGVTIGAYLAVMQVLGIEKNLERLAEEDPWGRQLQDSRLATKTRSVTVPLPPPHLVAGAADEEWLDEFRALSAEQQARALQSLRGKRASGTRGGSSVQQMRKVLATQPLQRVIDAMDAARASAPATTRRSVMQGDAVVEEEGYVSAEDLAALIQPAPSRRKR